MSSGWLCNEQGTSLSFSVFMVDSSHFSDVFRVLVVYWEAVEDGEKSLDC